MIKSQFLQWDLQNKRVFLRTDLNVPLLNGSIVDDFRLRSSTKTIDVLIEKGASIILATHIDRPKAPDPALSTQHLLPWFKDHGYNICFMENIDEVTRVHLNPGEIILLENLRFFPEEKASDPLFAKQLAQTATYYVNDAFGAIHNHDCSIAVLPYEFSENRRSIGLLVENELKICDELITNPQRPLILVIGGGKVAEKLPLIHGLLETADTILLCPAICFSFLKAIGQPVGTSLTNEKSFDLCRRIMDDAENYGTEIIFPLDYQITYDKAYETIEYTDANLFPPRAFGISIGPQTITLFESFIADAGTVFFNGAMGFVEYPQTLEGTRAILQAIADAPGISIIAGGDTTHAVFNLAIDNKIDYLSTGGGATLAYISNPLLPGLLPFEEE